MIAYLHVQKKGQPRKAVLFFVFRNFLRCQTYRCEDSQSSS